MNAKFLIIFLVAIAGIVIISCSILLSMRKDLPFQEIVPMDGKIAVINAGKWYQNNINIELFQDGSKSQKGQYDEYGVCIFENLSNNIQYTIEIKRTDLKGILLYKKFIKVITPNPDGINYTVLLGASVGKSWHFDKLPERTGVGNEFVFGNRTIYNFDKGSAIDDVIKVPVPNKNVIIKECSAYFPRDLKPSEDQIKLWVEKLKSNKVNPILATIVPVTKAHDLERPGRFDSIKKFNDFIRQYASQNKIPLLDLEKALRISDNDRHLKEEYAQPDGNHLLQKAYDERLDKIVMPVIKQNNKFESK